MNELTLSTGFNQDTFDAFLSARREPQWLTAARREAWQAFLSRPMPTRSEEEWMRTDIRPLKLDRYPLISNDGNLPSSSPMLLENVDVGGKTSSVNGVARHGALDEKWRAKGVIFADLNEAVQDHEDLVRKYLYSQVRAPWPDRLAALHAACWTSGTFLYVPRGVALDQPLHSLASLSEQATDFGHTLVILEDGASATYLNELGSPTEDAGGLHCGATEVILQSGSHLRFVTLQDWGRDVWHFAHQHASVQRDASLQWTVGALGSRLSKVNQQVSLVGPGAECQVNGVMFTEDRQHLSYHTLQHHQAPHCRSDFLYKAALQDQSRTVWRGMIKVDRVAQKTDGYQRNDNLLLSQLCRADAIPGLEIEADDVRCTHGATTGNVDEELVFYAQSRGYTRREAVRLVVTGFFQQVFDRITIESVREALGHAIARRVREVE